MNNCPYCGYYQHERVESCPSIKAIEYYQDGTIKRIEKRDLYTPIVNPYPIEPPWKVTCYA